MNSWQELIGFPGVPAVAEHLDIARTADDISRLGSFPRSEIRYSMPLGRAIDAIWVSFAIANAI